MPLRVKDLVYVQQTDFSHELRRDTKEFDKIATLCVSRVTEALRTPTGAYTQMHCNQLGDVFRSLLATQRGIRRMLDFAGPIDPESVDALLLARVQLEGLFSLSLMLEDSAYVTSYVQDHWRKQYVEYLIAKEETKFLPRFASFETPELQRLILLGQEFGIGAAHLHTVDEQELGIPLPPGIVAQPIQPFLTPGKAIKKITSSPDKKRMLERLYAKYVYLCSFAHGLPQANLLKNMFDSRFPGRRSLPDSAIQQSYQQRVVGEAYITSFMSIAQSTAEVTVLYPNNMDIIEAAVRAWEQLSGASPTHEGSLGTPNTQAPWRDFLA